MLETMLALKTNELILAFVINNVVLLELIRRTLVYIVSKTKSKADDDLPNFFSGLIGSVKNTTKNVNNGGSGTKV